jgi:tryptophan 2,3-dioxygenase
LAEYGEGGGANAVAAAQLSYSEYLQLPQLLALQVPLANPPVHDEMLFVIVHQAHELWFKQVIMELEALMKHIAVADWQRACGTLDRVSLIVTLLVQHIAVLETMPAAEFQRFRRVLGSASGMQSDQFKHIEELSGHVPADLTAPRAEPALGAGMPNVRQTFLGAVASRSELNVAAGANRTDPERLRSLYRDPDRAAERSVAERLLHFDAQMAHWRARHLELVHSMIGATMGTGGSSGVRYLQGTLGKRFFPELWAAREAELQSHSSPETRPI